MDVGPVRKSWKTGAVLYDTGGRITDWHGLVSEVVEVGTFCPSLIVPFQVGKSHGVPMPVPLILCPNMSHVRLLTPNMQTYVHHVTPNCAALVTKL